MIQEPKKPNRRTEERVEFESDCTIEMKAPSWTMLPEPVQGRTINITEHGIRVMFSDFPQSRFEKWDPYISRGDTIQVLICLTNADPPLELGGQIVWCQFDADNGKLGTCHVGILLSLQSPGIIERIHQLIDSNKS